MHNFRSRILGLLVLTASAAIGCTGTKKKDDDHPPPNPLELTIAFSTSGSTCKYDMSANDAMAVTRRTFVIHWNLDGSKCSGFKDQNVCLNFTDKVLQNGQPQLCGNGSGKITGVVTSNKKDAPKGSMHTYSIDYGVHKAGDPEIDIDNCGTCDE